MNFRKILAILSIIFSVLAAPAIASASTLSFAPSSGTLNAGCSYSIGIQLDTGGVATDGTDAIVFYDQSKINVTSITKGTLYPDYPVAAASNGRISVSGLASSPGQTFTGTGTFATINFTVAQQVSSAPMTLTFDFDPSNPTKTNDSNVAQDGTLADTLSQAPAGNYTLGTGQCSSLSTGNTGTGTGTGGIGGPTSTDSGTLSPTPLPSKLPVAGGVEPTTILAISGGVFTILGILGLALL